MDNDRVKGIFWKSYNRFWNKWKDETLPRESDKKEDLVQHLAAYEDTGLTPGQIQEMDQLYLDKCREVTELKRRLEWIPVTEPYRPED